MIAAPVIGTQRLHLEPVRISHAGEVWPLLNDDRMWTYFPHLRPHTLADLRRLYGKWERGSPDASEVWWNWVCRERASGAIAGAMQATIFPVQQLAYVAYAVFPIHQRKGYALEALRAVMQIVSASFIVDRFIAEMDVRNEASQRLAESAGFTRVETRDGEYAYERRV
jgi:RimJ/RimL family protein N-acetyltransferase